MKKLILVFLVVASFYGGFYYSHPLKRSVLAAELPQENFKQRMADDLGSIVEKTEKCFPLSLKKENLQDINDCRQDIQYYTWDAKDLIKTGKYKEANKNQILKEIGEIRMKMEKSGWYKDGISNGKDV